MDISLIAETRFSWFELASWIAIAKMVVGFGFLIFVHELGHFLAAKACGVRCDKFYIGFDAFDIKIGDFVLIPRRLFHFQWGETEYGIGIIPLGGYVKMLGQVDNPAEQQAEFARVRGEGGDTEAGGTESPKAGEENIEGSEPLDPRSFPAKSVPQRLFIISAGVVMNLIFAVVLAMIAFSMGAPFQPAVVGGVVAGGPAWMADVQPGTRILHVNGDSKPPEHLRWVDIASGVALTGIGHEVTLEVLEPASETPKDLTLVPTGELIKARNVSLGSVGIEPVSSNQLADNDKAIFAGMAASTAEPPLMPADRVVAVNGVETAFGHDLKRELLIHYDEPVTLTVQRLGGKPTDKVENRPVEQLEIVVQPQPYLDYGISVGFGPIAAVQPGSPAATAGLQPGDQIQAIDDQPIADIVLLPGMMRRAARSGQTVKFTILRGEGTIDLSVQPRLPRMLLDAPGHMPMGIDELGITVELLTEIAAVRTGSPADAAGLKAGDSLVSAQFLEGGTTLTAKSKLRATPEEFTFEEWPQIWPTIMDVTQFMASENELKLVVQRGDEKQTVRLKPVRLDGEWSRGRGFSLQPYEEILTAYSFSEAVSLGFREAKESTFQVYLTLRQIMRGRVSVINLRGPGTIAAGATQMALRGDAVLLLFLTLISANLAVVNFLPIPVLDGGHAVFLIYEGIFGKPPSERVYVMLSYIGLFMLIGLMLFVLTLDAFQWIIPLSRPELSGDDQGRDKRSAGEIARRADVIALDVVGTIIDTAEPFPVTYARVARRFGVEADAEQVAARFPAAMRSIWGDGSSETDEDSERERWQQVVRAVLPDVGERFEDVFDELWVHFSSATAWTWFPDARALVERLIGEQRCWGLASNFDGRLHLWTKTQSLARAASFVRTSADLGVLKRDPLFYERLAGTALVGKHREMIVAPESEQVRMVMIGDQPANDYEPAIAAGWDAICLCRTEAAWEAAAEAGRPRIRTLAELFEPSIG